VDIKRILCPTDFSETSAHAVDQAIALAGYSRGQITALHVLSPMSLAVAGTATSAEETSQIDRARLQTAVGLSAARERGVGVDVVVEIGRPADVIVQRARDLPADLIVMGTHGASGFQHLVLGSVTEKVLRWALCPVLTVPPRAQATSTLPFERLVCAVDFSDASLDAVRFALSLASESHAALTLVHVLEWPWDEPPAPRLSELPHQQGAALAEFRRYTETSAWARLESLVPNELPASQVTTELRSGKPYAQILDVASTRGADLILAGVRGRNVADVAFFGSTANQLVRRATCPVLTLR
jgi:nucleotide-binding universal stress UspA family protein